MSHSMSEKYDEYLKNHRDNVYNGFLWLKKNVPEIFDRGDLNDTNKFISDVEFQCRYEHDKSKWSEKEYDAYDKYFYGGNKSYEVVNQFNRAWLHHIHMNPHHWQYWILNNDNPDEGEIILDMPDIYIIEMICDWWSFSFGKGNLYEIFDWYNGRKQYMKLSDYTRMKVEDILSKIKDKLDLLEDVHQFADQETMQYGG